MVEYPETTNATDHGTPDSSSSEELNEILFRSAPTTIPSTVFVVLFTITTLLLAYRGLRTLRAFYLQLLLFSLTRDITFMFRLAWSGSHHEAQQIAVAAAAFEVAGNFLVTWALFALLEDWRLFLSYGTPEYKKGKIFFILIKIAVMGISMIALIAATNEHSDKMEDYNLGVLLRKISIIGFTAILLLILGLIPYYALTIRAVYHHTGIRDKVVLPLFLGPLLLLIGRLYQITLYFSPKMSAVVRNQWWYYLFATTPEVLVCYMYGLIDFEKNFYSRHDALLSEEGHKEGGEEDKDKVTASEFLLQHYSPDVSEFLHWEDSLSAEETFFDNSCEQWKSLFTMAVLA
ncbi:23_t:CDS:2 [Ambispora leptoticha]|uniref:23_t:CDS:1 n=1 Tax=Ambispora leptoticha TaxID=144679 RepID=A0A9N9FYR6_9GLOM|nr:23_t:CDS:2 [Ambispora leptoticha]